jgi:3-oxoacyl-[acyl-carrier-protein] synthase-3
MRFALAGTGVYLPEAAGGRPRAGVGETTSMMAAAAADRALGEAGWRVDELDALVGASSVMEQPIPGTAALIGRRLGAGGAMAFDVNATCLSALVALDLAVTGIAAGRWRRVLVAGADLPSRAIAPADAELAAIFGDGGAALAVGEGPHHLLASRFETHGAHADLCTIEAGGTRLDPFGDREAFLAASRFRMAGLALYRATARLFPPFLDRLLGEAGVRAGDLDLVIPHQASRPALDHLRRVLGVAPERVVDIFDVHGNQVAASLPHALHLARGSGRLRSGMTVLLVGSAAGVSLGGMVVRW